MPAAVINTCKAMMQITNRIPVFTTGKNDICRLLKILLLIIDTAIHAVS